jgi:hypothetical protein
LEADDIAVVAALDVAEPIEHFAADGDALEDSEGVDSVM